MPKFSIAALAGLTVLMSLGTQGLAQSTPFIYQGRLGDATGVFPGNYDMRFRLYTDATVGAPDTQIGPTLTFSGGTAIQVDENGTFSVSLDFLAPAFVDRDAQFLQIDVKPSAAPTYTTLTPRQALTLTPYATLAVQADYALEAGELRVPTSMVGSSASDNTAILNISNTRASGGAGFITRGQFWGGVGFGGDLSPYPAISLPIGLQGVSDNYGVAGVSNPGVGVYGTATTGTGGLFESRNFPGVTSTALHVRNLASAGRAALFEQGVTASNVPTLDVTNASTVSNAFGVRSTMTSTSPGGFSAAVRAQNNGTGGLGIGTWTSHAGSGWGLFSTVSDGGVAVNASGGGTTGWAGFFSGRVNVTGALVKGSGTFRIDHPLDPENKFLSHSFVESPDMMNIYNGIATSDASGYAVVTMPAYFEALNMDYRYQLTIIDEGNADEFVQAKIVSKIKGNQFTIRTSKPGTQVSWQVTGVRQDAYANRNRVVVEEEKSAGEKGKYLHPEAFGLPADRAIVPTLQAPAGQGH